MFQKWDERSHGQLMKWDAYSRAQRCCLQMQLLPILLAANRPYWQTLNSKSFKTIFPHLILLFVLTPILSSLSLICPWFALSFTALPCPPIWINECMERTKGQKMRERTEESRTLQPGCIVQSNLFRWKERQRRRRKTRSLRASLLRTGWLRGKKLSEPTGWEGWRQSRQNERQKELAKDK